ncbi:DNA cytosine methyltransferase [Ferrovibrio terrae]|uniref:DNA (cytosine-5-)-methyltransferase n=1 Tax=Ferrovibrio terrae TaxID=2594003 RepID=A0A516GYR3_9PROT|nr:DNA cytosine methyltransferase [Ferrovibrio terrae]QDO96647.1 DNA cytosine methyltransferase [Ferrovibrio terrae]
MTKTIPVIDIFAGPGGLGEGFTGAHGAVKFDVRLSCEMDETACHTLRLRKFFHLATGKAREAYYEAVKHPNPDGTLARQFPELWAKAAARVLNIRLGDNNRRNELHSKIKSAIGGENFVLIGGPPCQAYSLVGRARRLGIGDTRKNAAELKKQREEEFYQDEKHGLYREYLEILAVHEPAVFVMENVKGLASARTGADAAAGSVSELILRDLQNPSKAVSDNPHLEVRPWLKGKNARYRLISLSAEQIVSLGQSDMFAEKSIRDFVLRSEVYGVPQARHRVIIVGIRADLTGEIKPLKKMAAPTSARAVLEAMPSLRSHLSKGLDDAAVWVQAIREQAAERLTGAGYGLGIANWVKDIAGLAATRNSGSQWYARSPKKIKDAEALQAWLHDPELNGILQHQARGHMSSDLARYLFCAAYAEKHERSPKLSDWPSGELRPAHRNVVVNKNGQLEASGFADRFKVQGIGRQPSSTITSHIAKDGHYYIHYDPVQCRSLTVREAARLQTFPDNYFFCGNRTQQYHQVGNAVPSYLAKQIAERIAGFLKSAF